MTGVNMAEEKSKEKIDFQQFFTKLVIYQSGFIEENFDKIVDFNDESKVLTQEDRKDLYSIVDIFMLADIWINCMIHLSDKLTWRDIGYATGSVYPPFVSCAKKINKKEAKNKLDDFMDFFADYQTRMLQIATDTPVLELCSKFADYYMKKIVRSEENIAVQEKHLAAYNFALTIAGSDVVGYMLKENIVDFN
jgi:hypothetical protein